MKVIEIEKYDGDPEWDKMTEEEREEYPEVERYSDYYPTDV